MLPPDWISPQDVKLLGLRMSIMPYKEFWVVHDYHATDDARWEVTRVPDSLVPWSSCAVLMHPKRKFFDASGLNLRHQVPR